MPIRDAALKAGVFPEDIKLVLKDIADRIVLNDERKIVVLDEDGDPTDIKLERFFESNYKEERPKFYPPSGASGSGAPAGTGSGGGKIDKNLRRSQMSDKEQQDFVREHGIDKFKELPA